MNDILELKKDFQNGQWQVPAAKVAEKQAAYRRLKFRLQMQEEFEKARSGTASQRQNLLPLVLRREMHDLAVPPEPTGKQDGELFTFAEPEYVAVEGEGCGCGFVNPEIHTEAEIQAHIFSDNPDSGQTNCPKLVKIQRQAEVHQNKHVRGSWLCRGCLLAAAVDLGTEQMSLPLNPMWFNPDRQIRWCPNFMLSLAEMGPVRYAIEVQRVNPDIPICYAGLLHSESKLETNSMTFTWKCDTCLFTQTKTETFATAEPVRPGEMLIDNIDSKEAAEIIQGLTADPISPDQSSKQESE